MKRCPSCGEVFPLDAGFCPHEGKILVADPDPESPDPRLGTQVGGRFVLVAIVADGAHGRVYEARETTTRTKYAVKVLHEHTGKDAIAVERFKREADTARSIDHPNVLEVYDFGRDPVAGFYLAMEFLDGEDLGALMARGGPLRPGRFLRILSQIALALGAAHPRGFVHRDIKPENVFILHGDEIRLLDFGSVKRQEETGPKLTALGTTLGSPYYMAPEQAKGLPTIDARADVFSLACIAYEALTGTIAFQADNMAAILYRILSENPTPPSFANHDLPEEVDDAFRRALAKEPEARTATAGDFCREIARALGVRKGSPETWAAMTGEEIDALLVGKKAVAAGGAESVPPVVWIAVAVVAAGWLVALVALGLSLLR